MEHRGNRRIRNSNNSNRAGKDTSAHQSKFGPTAVLASPTWHQSMATADKFGSDQVQLVRCSLPRLPRCYLARLPRCSLPRLPRCCLPRLSRCSSVSCSLLTWAPSLRCCQQQSMSQLSHHLLFCKPQWWITCSRHHQICRQLGGKPKLGKSLIEQLPSKSAFVCSKRCSVGTYSFSEEKCEELHQIQICIFTFLSKYVLTIWCQLVERLQAVQQM